MEPLQLLEIIQQGESSSVQFKERLPHLDKLAQEMSAFSNTDGGKIIIGVNDKTGELNGISFQEIDDINKQLVNVASQAVFPPIFIKTQTVKVKEAHFVIIVEVNEGISKPYKDRNGTIYMKNGSDKGIVTSNAEFARLLQNRKIMFADEIPVPGTTIADINLELYKSFIHTKYGRSLEDLGVDLKSSLERLNLSKDGRLTLAGLLLFSDHRQTLRPQFTIQCVSVDDFVVTGNSFSDGESPIDGNILNVYQKAMGVYR